MHIAPPLAFFVLALASCTADRTPPPLLDRMEAPQPPLDVMTFDITQANCALFVAVRSHALEENLAFGRTVDEDVIHWNMCPSGNMVACATVPGPQGMPMRTGIPWPYPPPARH